ncbi:sulfite exporter TauE/SafE family protein [Citricoccus muralis]|uniref:Probable membrane transporter protein n=1 Tax=Citricoccus muralis TaxID=169134 RepID=A0ABY8H4H1_9MICC|nr:sulfite exporter TauE/SafE family protein [Citricoccus muralis]WFP16041.1 sulfite exporter TauE/SafE family protein [Citricoccus muralis]
METWMVLAAVAAGLVGACLQRVSGAGVGLVVTPVMVLLFGPVAGVLLTNATSIVSALLIMTTVWAGIDWKRLSQLAPIGVLGALVGATLVAELPAAWLQIVVGAVVLLTLVMTFSLPRLPEWTGPVPALSAGVVGGFLNTVAGVAMPAMVIFAQVSRWPQRAFAATMQPVFFLFGVFSVAIKLLLGAAVVEVLPPWWFFALVGLGVVVGIVLGTVLSRHVQAERARILAVVLAGVGAAVTVVRGILAL